MNRTYGTTVEELRKWFDEGECRGNDFMLVIQSTINGDEFPVYVSPNHSLSKEQNKWHKIYRVMAKYDLSLSFSEQSDSFRTVIFDTCDLPYLRVTSGM